MASSPISKAQAVVLRSSEPNIIRDRLSKRLSQRSTSGRWLTASNRYDGDVVSRIRADLAPTKRGGINVPPRGISHLNIADYIAVSLPLHALDGWAFWGRAVAAYLVGDYASVVHLGYYAELRAAMALLASAGIGVFSNQHVSLIQSSGSILSQIVADRQLGTHRMVWPAMWLRLQKQDVAEQVLRSMLVGRASVWEWLSRFTVGNRVALSKHWLRAWGVDLRRLGEDHGSRNEASYRPSSLRARGVDSIAARSALVIKLWKMLEPVGRWSFEIDKYLLRSALRQIFQSTKGLPTTDPSYSVEARACIAAVAESESAWLPLLTDGTSSDPTPTTLALQDSWTNDSELAGQVLSRAMLLLRLSNASLAAATSDGPLQINCVEWFSQVGIDRGLWRDTATAATLRDSWADVRDALGALGKLGADSWGSTAPEIASVIACSMGEYALAWSLGHSAGTTP